MRAPNDGGSFNIMIRCPALHSYVGRLARDHDLEIDVRNFRRIVLIGRAEGSRYRSDRIVIKVTTEGEIDCSEGFEPTEEEAAAIKAQLSSVTFPKSYMASQAGSDIQRIALGVAKEDWFEMFDSTRTGIVMCQQRFEKRDGKKSYLPWSHWNDGVWRRMEPDGDGLPLWRPSESRNRIMIMIHEGAKAARYADWLVNDRDLPAREARAKHPWAKDLAMYEHWGWIGGAPNAHRTNWKELQSYPNLEEVAVVTDNDLEGKRAIRHIARRLKFLRVRVWEVRFDDGFPDGFDLADHLPQKLWVRGRYRGPSLSDCRRSATWATKKSIVPKEGSGSKTAKYEARTAFLEQWVVSAKPPVFVHRNDPGRLFDENEFNAVVRAFSDVKNTAETLREEPAVQFDGVAYEPGCNAGIITLEGRKLINTWTPTRIGRVKGDSTQFLEFMTHLIPVEKDRAHTLKWCATLIACLDVKMKYGILMISEEQGVGKGTLMEKVLAPIVGWQNVSIPSEKHLVDSQFNSYLVRRRLVLVHEIYAGHSKKAYDSVKSDVTEEYIDVEEKYLPVYRIRNWSHFLLSSNSLLALRLVKNDRRWFVPQVTEAKKDSKYWVDFNAWLIDGGLEIIHQWAHDYVAEHGSVGAGDDAPISDAKNELVQSSRSEGQQLVFDLGEAAMRNETEVILTDREVRGWLSGERQMAANDPRLESLLTVRTQLRSAGMVEVARHKLRGVRHVALANQKAVNSTQQAIASMSQATSEGTWQVLVAFMKASREVVAADEQGEQDLM
jgi:hypothetical protein